jgi:hypothetical protein
MTAEAPKYKTPFYPDDPLRQAQEVVQEVGRISYFLHFVFDMAAHYGFVTDFPMPACQGVSDLHINISAMMEQAEQLLETAHQDRMRDHARLAEKENPS